MNLPVDFYDDKNPEQEPVDRTKWLWLAVAIVFVLAIAALWLVTRRSADISQVRAKHILIKFAPNDPAERAQALEQVTRLREQILAGANFNRLAKEFSNDEFSSARGGDLGYWPRGAFEPAFEAYVWSGKVGELSDLVQTNRGFHLIVITDRTISKADQYEMDLEQKAIDSQAPTAPAQPAQK